MAEPSSGVQTSFRDLEQKGWTAKASAYDAWAGAVTAGAAEPLLDAAEVRPGKRMLDVACGPGYGAGRAAASGATAIGVDFAPTMIAEARRRFPGIDFREGDGENLAFEDGSFDAVICAFGLLHMPEPDKAIAEAHRVLRSGGRYAFTVWAAPDWHEFLGLVLNAVRGRSFARRRSVRSIPTIKLARPVSRLKVHADAKCEDQKRSDKFEAEHADQSSLRKSMRAI
jgi:ubiquinone/menaquinone biosynthesis C-methylase UbiE